MTEAEIKLVVKATIAELRHQGMLRDDIQQAYQVIAQRLKKYFCGASDPQLAEVLDSMRNDMYYEVLTLYYRDGLKIESVADAIKSDTSTVSRHKKRLCLEIYSELY